MNISSGIRALVLLVMMASTAVSSGCTDIMDLLLCGELSHWKFSKFGCVGPDREKMKALGEAHNKCDEEGGEWILATLTCSYAARDKEKAKTANNNAAVKPEKLPDKPKAK
jgi:hypothetical protein